MVVLFVYLFLCFVDCLFGGLIVRSLVCLYVYSLGSLIVFCCSFACLFGWLFVRRFIFVFVCLVVCSFLCLFV